MNKNTKCCGIIIKRFQNKLSKLFFKLHPFEEHGDAFAIFTRVYSPKFCATRRFAQRKRDKKEKRKKEKKKEAEKKKKRRKEENPSLAR
ncbi:hypothetical protein PUN28_008446 [Cardiocondyla obscurior]|uniref:Uncharacterized protein n=1 Tax=Cardiocondyla obscurior TaxID=286306 RepID=A0AAW2G149_9HYME